MANIKRGARAYYADTDYRRDGMNEAYSKIDSMPSIPTPTAEDVGKVVKVGGTGAYELGSVEALPAVTSADSGKVLTVNENGEWVAAPFSPGAEVSPLNYFQLPRGNGDITLGFKPTDCDELIIIYQTGSTPSGNLSVISTAQTSWDTRRAINIGYDNTNWYACNNLLGTFEEGEFEFKFNMLTNKAYKDGTELFTFANDGILNEHELKIGGLGGLAGSSNYGAYFKRIQGFKNNQLIHDLIPVKIGDNAYYFMDQITGLIVGGKDWTVSTDTIGG